MTVAVPGGTMVTDPTYARGPAPAGMGIAHVFEPPIAADLAAGRLPLVLEAARMAGAAP